MAIKLYNLILKEYCMTEQELLTDLAVAERNMKQKSIVYSVDFFNKVADAFRLTRANSFAELINVDLRLALELLDLAIKERLIFYEPVMENELEPVAVD